MKVGATKEEIMETLRAAQYISGVKWVYTAAHAYKDPLLALSSIGKCRKEY